MCSKIIKGSERTLIAGRKPHNNDVLGVFDVRFRGKDLHYLIIDDAGIGIINGTMTTNQELRMFFLRQLRRLFFEKKAEFVVRINDVGDT